MYERCYKKSEDDCRCQSVNNVLAGIIVVTTCSSRVMWPVAWSAHHGGEGSVTPDGQSHHSLSDTGHITSMAGERVKAKKTIKNSQKKVIIISLFWFSY